MSLPLLLEQKSHVDICVVETLPDDWKRSIIRYLDDLSGKHDCKTRVHATNYIVYQNELYRNSDDGLLLLCLDLEEALKLLPRCMKEYAVLINSTVKCVGYSTDIDIYGRVF